MVAPSYQSYKIVSEPFQKGNKMYIKIEHPNTHNVRDARFYTEAEYDRAYGKKATNQFSSSQFNQRKVLGFGEKNYVTIFKGPSAHFEDYFNKSPMRYCTYWGWYLPSEEEVPEDLPAQLLPVKLGWSIVCADENNLAEKEKVQKAIRVLFKEI